MENINLLFIHCSSLWKMILDFQVEKEEEETNECNIESLLMIEVTLLVHAPNHQKRVLISIT